MRTGDRTNAAELGVVAFIKKAEFEPETFLRLLGTEL